jgi:dihydrofolate synthase/folylpolyglutamate synthase
VIEAAADYVMTEDTRPSFDGLGWSLPDLDLSLQGRFQRENAGTALASLAAAAPRGVSVTEAAIRQGLASLKWPGRLEIVESAPLIILDGAHNPEGIANLVSELPRVMQDRDLHVLFAVMRDKNWQAMAGALAPLCASAVITEVLPPRGLPARQAADVFRRHCPTDVVADPVRAWHAIRARGRERDCILVAGSLFLIGAVYPHCRGAASASATELRL